MNGSAVNGSGGLTMELDAEHLAPLEVQGDVDTGIVGESMDGEDDHEIEDAPPSIEDVKAGLNNLSGGIATAQDVENAARAEEGLPPLEAAGLLDFGPFNPDKALKAIFDKSVEVDLFRSSWQRKAEDAKDAKKEYEIASTALLNLINTFKLRRQQALNPSQPYLRDVSSDAPTMAVSNCPWEREHPGQPCPICTAANAKDLVPALESEVHPEHEGHAAIAEAARVKNVLEPLAERLVRVNVFAEAIDLQQLTTEDLTALIAYADEPTPMPPQLLARCCRAAEPGSIMQVCQNCEKVLLDERAATAQGDWFPVNTLVGFACKSYVPRDQSTAAADQLPDGATATDGVGNDVTPRKPRSHAKKNRARKTTPEDVRRAQVEEGKKRSAPKRAAKKAAKRGKGSK